ncbi:hypothetical protein V9T40_002100 [Parthenolecanium corni]|uniref:Uncharacterized protein n=1 Tax=Parthenolecanium corni TaxID=536013 RepID=A0AAN9TTW7_9HEMI
MGVLEVAELESDVRFWRRLSPSEMWPNKDEKWSKMDLNGDVDGDMGVREVAEIESDVRFWRRLSPSEMWPNKDEKWSKMDLNGDVE